MSDNCNGVNFVIKQEVISTEATTDIGEVAQETSVVQEIGDNHVNSEGSKSPPTSKSNTGEIGDNFNSGEKDNVTVCIKEETHPSDEIDMCIQGSGTVPIGVKVVEGVEKKLALEPIDNQDATSNTESTKDNTNVSLEDSGVNKEADILDLKDEERKISKSRSDPPYLLYRKECAAIYASIIPRKYHTATGEKYAQSNEFGYHCEKCKMNGNGCTFYMHLRGKKHQMRCRKEEYIMKLHLNLPPMPRNPLDIEDTTNNADSITNNANVSLESSVVNKCVDKNVDSAVQKPNPKNSKYRTDSPYLLYLKKCADIYDEHIPAKYHTNETSNSQPKVPLYNCQTCLVTGIGSQIFLHLKGKKHQLKCTGEEYLTSLNPNLPSMPPKPLDNESSTATLIISSKIAKLLQHIPKRYMSIKPKPGDNGCQRYFCYKCNDSTLDIQTFWTHLKSQKHQQICPQDEFILKIDIDLANVEHSAVNPKPKPLLDLMLGPKAQGLEALLEANNTNEEKTVLSRSQKRNLRMKHQNQRRKIEKQLESQSNESSQSSGMTNFESGSNLSSPYKYMLEQMQQSVSRDKNKPSQTQLEVPAQIQPISTQKTPLLESPVESSTRIKRPLLEAPGPSSQTTFIPEKRPRIDLLQSPRQSESVMSSFLVVLKNISVKNEEEAAVATQIISILSQALMQFWSCDKSRPTPEFVTTSDKSKSAMASFLGILKNTRIEKEEDARVATQIISTLSQALVEFRSCETSTSNRINRRSPSPEVTVATFEPKS